MKSKLNISLLFLSVITAVVLYFVASAANHGVDLTDEGLYLLSTTAEYKSVVSVSYSHLFIGWFADLFNLQIVGLRVLRLVLLISSAMVLAFGVRSYFKQFVQGLNLLEINLMVIIASCLGYAFGPQTISYNSFLAIAVNFAVGFLLLGISAEINKKVSRAALVALGMMLIPVVLTKVTSGVLFSGLVLLVFLIIKRRSAWLDLLFVAAGFIAGIVLFTVLIGSFVQTVQHIWIAGNYLAGEESHSAQSLIEEAKKFFKMAGMQALWAVGVILILKFIDLMQSSPGKFGAKQLMQGLVVAISAGLLIKKYTQASLTPVITEIVVFVVLVLCFVQLKNQGFKKLKIESRFFVYLLLALMPLVCAFGTNNPLSINALFNMPFWLILIYLFLSGMQSKALKIAVLALTGILITHNVYLKLWQNPYRQLPLSEQNTRLDLSMAPDLLVDSQTADFLQKLDTVLKQNGFKTGGSVVGMFKMPGIIYLLGAKAPGGTLWNEAVSSLYFYNLDQEKERVEPYFIINSNCSPEFAEKLNSYFSFPANYTMCGQLQNGEQPYLVFAPNSRAVKQ